MSISIWIPCDPGLQCCAPLAVSTWETGVSDRWYLTAAGPRAIRTDTRCGGQPVGGSASPLPAEAGGTLRAAQREDLSASASQLQTLLGLLLQDLRLTTDRPVLICCVASFIPSRLFHEEKKKSQNTLSSGNKPARIFILFLFSVTVTSPCLALSLAVCTSKLNIVFCSHVLVPSGFFRLQGLVQGPDFT